MGRQLDDVPSTKDVLNLKKVEKNEVREFLAAADHCTSGSYEGEDMLFW